MPRPVPVLVQTYRGHRLFVLDDGGAGCSVLVEGGHPVPAPDAGGRSAIRLA
jgi:hypothetical protein